MKKIITALSAGVLAIAFSSVGVAGHHEPGEGMPPTMGADGKPPMAGGMPHGDMPMGADGKPPMAGGMPHGDMPIGPKGMPMGPDGMPMPMDGMGTDGMDEK